MMPLMVKDAPGPVRKNPWVAYSGYCGVPTNAGAGTAMPGDQLEPVPLASIRYHADLSDLPLIRQSQLSVMALTKEEFETIVAMGDGKKRR